MDADVVDAELMPAVDSPEPGGLTYQARADVLRALVSDTRVRGLELTIYDPDSTRTASWRRAWRTRSSPRWP